MVQYTSLESPRWTTELVATLAPGVYLLYCERFSRRLIYCGSSAPKSRYREPMQLLESLGLRGALRGSEGLCRQCAPDTMLRSSKGLQRLILSYIVIS